LPGATGRTLPVNRLMCHANSQARAASRLDPGHRTVDSPWTSRAGAARTGRGTLSALCQ